MRRLHIGPGKCYLPGWENVDLLSNTKADVYCDAGFLPYPMNHFDIIYASHVLEHFSRLKTLAVLTHWRALLKDGGILRIAVPDFSAIVHRYKTNELGLEELLGLLYGGQASIGNFHFVVFDEDYLTACLRKVGFVVVRRWDWRFTEHAEFDDYSQSHLPHMNKEHGLLMSLNLEAVK